jgi:hypothetical protein
MLTTIITAAEKIGEENANENQKAGGGRANPNSVVH